ncbi:hypothetical protein T440DRAFT_471774 [Plenodomus tracheiphilus IPT5]|uniref:Uncharacterized protein n=1 Tax=Plenodomus tracheiphilus IPT5 TaxID=1408161 RepID=A0A6A7AWF2_9PLEO|nr:hypothetical protein T440DRAFT_471774 [Plenodomus tracheiphilus IPT5]
MRTLVFATCDVTPEQWAIFKKEACCLPGIDDMPVPYTLVFSNHQENLHETTGLHSPVKSELVSATYAELKTLFDNFSTADDIENIIFLIIDSQSFIDHTVVLILRRMAWQKPDGTDMNIYDESSRPEYTKYITWGKHRAPFINTFTIQSGHMGCGPPVEEFFVEELEREVLVESEPESSSEESEDSRDYEYEE